MKSLPRVSDREQGLYTTGVRALDWGTNLRVLEIAARVKSSYARYENVCSTGERVIFRKLHLDASSISISTREVLNGTA